ncbi:NEL-type E3 ubiquitin ligase domain-containing protein [Pseudomonas mandelii]|uniref:NEL-type E3 ubiquitin ligase domain-containing protein n=1 Tax=Pseudomonas mandelii TaxID=75612 RepID=UPI00224B8221|nr:NEL-type E3 ubiquitin ligase domain-containing protein [Pseudomonas mandelii]MCX2900807.1 NEL-type E3 ubiquitin ligase domain-containing protein [Pseudomonas mandelii]
MTELDLSFNELTITQSTQARLNRMGRLRMLNLAYNRVGTLNVTALTDLQSLSLSHSNVSNWPEGVLSLPRLRTLNLDHSAITDVPEQALTGHDQLLARTSLQGCRLSWQGLEGVRSYAERTTGANPLGIPRTQLALGRTGGDPQFYPPEAWELPDLVLPLHLEPGAGQVPQTSAARLQRLDPQLGDAEAVARIEAWLAQGVSAIEIENQLVQWQQQQTQLIRLFNDWMVTPATRARHAWVTAQDRRRAADQLLESWRAGLREVPQAGIIVDFNGLIIGDLPAMPVTFNHVVELNLSGVGLSIESDAFLRAFPRLRSLTLDHNGLGRLPDAVANCQDLTHLNARHNDFRANGPLQSQLRALPRLQGLNLSQNRLFEFDLAGLDQLQTLDLGSNNLDEWPAGVLQAPALTTLDLTNNHISTIPHDALQPEHEDLMAGTDLSDNMLEEEEFIRLQFYLDRTGNGLGFTDDEIDRVLMGFGPEESSEGSDEAIHPDHETAQAQKERWFAGVAADSEKHLMWDTLRTADDTGDFSYILSQLQHTADFQSDRLGLTRRVWRVVEAAYGDEALRERLLGLARALRSRATCGDGRILLFNELETEVYEFEALKSIEPEHQGRELLKLSRGLFRLAQVEEFAKERIARNPAIDPAEVRLAFRIGLAQRLELPGQPKGMLYRGMSGVTQADLDSAYSTIRAQEKTPVFVEQLIQRTYWIEYLKKKYAAEFVTLQQQFQAEYALLEDKYPDMNPVYERELTELTRTNTSRQQTLLTTLSNREISDPDVAS